MLFLQTDYPELYEEAVSRSLTILLPDIRQGILTPFSMLSSKHGFYLARKKDISSVFAINSKKGKTLKQQNISITYTTHFSNYKEEKKIEIFNTVHYKLSPLATKLTNVKVFTLGTKEDSLQIIKDLTVISCVLSKSDNSNVIIVFNFNDRKLSFTKNGNLWIFSNID